MPDPTTTGPDDLTPLQKRVIAAGLIPQAPIRPQPIGVQAVGAQAAAQPKLTPISTPALQPVGQPMSPGGLQKIDLAGDPANRAPLNFHERQALPVVSPGAPAGSLESNEAQLARIKDQEANPKGSAENSPGTWGKIQHVLGKVGNIAGDVLIPRVMATIPGTELNRTLQERGLQGEIDTQQKEQNTAEATKAAGALGTRRADIDTREADIKQEQADTDKEKSQFAEKHQDLAHEYADAVDAVLAKGGDPRTDPHVQQLGDSIISIQKQPVAKTPNDFDQFYTGFLKDKNLTDTAANRLKARTEWEAAAAKPPTGSFMPLYDETGKVTGAWDPTTGKIQHAPTQGLPGTTSQGQGIESKAANVHNKEIETNQRVLDHAQMADEAAKNPTGPGDYTLLMSFVDATKPSSGFRFTEAERHMIIGARGLADAATAKYDEYTKGPFLGPEQRATMLGIIHNAAAQAKKNMDRLQTAPGGGAPAQAQSGDTQPETQVHNGFSYTKGADGQWHKGKAVQP
jgi:hypothetical protein